MQKIDHHVFTYRIDKFTSPMGSWLAQELYSTVSFRSKSKGQTLESKARVAQGEGVASWDEDYKSCSMSWAPTKIILPT